MRRPNSTFCRAVILVDTLGLLLNVAVHRADVQDRDGTALVPDKTTRSRFPFLQVIFADGGYQGNVAATKVRDTGDWRLEIASSAPIRPRASSSSPSGGSSSERCHGSPDAVAWYAITNGAWRHPSPSSASP
ncbi:transposase [Roseomonas genomospecies 6]|uniref:transposase n=1 Tax=Roseomonas genomospecies 6 TaxID=214106 RepID=UPI0025701F0C|nr:transposase [Roseomonas genomospecies 6]